MSLRPPLSVVIPSYRGQALLEKHLPQVRKQLQAGDEIIVVDDASPQPDDTLRWLEAFSQQTEQKGIRIQGLQNEENLRFAATVNVGVAASTHPTVWLLNNDVSPLTPRSAEQAWQHFSQDPTLFAVGCAEVTEPTSTAQRFGRGTGNFRRGLLVHWYDPNQSEATTLWTAGGSMFVDRQKFLALGGMDPAFAPAYEEDRDLSYRALKRGWNLKHDAEIVVLHQHETTNQSVFGQKGIAITSWKNQFLLVWKNIGDLSLLLQHLLWLPYHLLVTNFRERGAVGLGFLRALSVFGQIWSARQREKSYWKRTDREILLAYGSTPPRTQTQEMP